MIITQLFHTGIKTWYPKKEMYFINKNDFINNLQA